MSNLERETGDTKAQLPHFAAAAAAKRISDCNPHDWRLTCMDDLLAAGLDLNMVRQLVDHRNGRCPSPRGIHSSSCLWMRVAPTRLYGRVLYDQRAGG